MPNSILGLATLARDVLPKNPSGSWKGQAEKKICSEKKVYQDIECQAFWGALSVTSLQFRRAPGMDGMGVWQVATRPLCVRMASNLYQGVKEDQSPRRAVHNEMHVATKGRWKLLWVHIED